MAVAGAVGGEAIPREVEPPYLTADAVARITRCVFRRPAEADADLLFVFGPNDPPELRQWRGHRAIGVVYRPAHEQYGNYVPTVLGRRYDAFLFLDHTTAVRPLFRPTEAELPEEAPETYPTGV